MTGITTVAASRIYAVRRAGEDGGLLEERTLGQIAVQAEALAGAAGTRRNQC